MSNNSNSNSDYITRTSLEKNVDINYRDSESETSLDENVNVSGSGSASGNNTNAKANNTIAKILEQQGIISDSSSDDLSSNILININDLANPSTLIKPQKKVHVTQSVGLDIVSPADDREYRRQLLNQLTSNLPPNNISNNNTKTSSSASSTVSVDDKEVINTTQLKKKEPENPPDSKKQPRSTSAPKRRRAETESIPQGARPPERKSAAVTSPKRARSSQSKEIQSPPSDKRLSNIIKSPRDFEEIMKKDSETRSKTPIKTRSSENSPSRDQSGRKKEKKKKIKPAQTNQADKRNILSLGVTEPNLRRPLPPKVAADVSASDSKKVGSSNSSPPRRIADDWIKLNVGGQIFLTTKSTLTAHKGSVLAVMFGDELKLKSSRVDENGAYVIDRDPKYFSPILNYLRCGKLIVDAGVNIDGVLEEAKYFALKDIEDHITWKLKKKRKKNYYVAPVDVKEGGFYKPSTELEQNIKHVLADAFSKSQTFESSFTINDRIFFIFSTEEEYLFL